MIIVDQSQDFLMFSKLTPRCDLLHHTSFECLFLHWVCHQFWMVWIVVLSWRLRKTRFSLLCIKFQEKLRNKILKVSPESFDNKIPQGFTCRNPPKWRFHPPYNIPSAHSSSPWWEEVERHKNDAIESPQSFAHQPPCWSQQMWPDIVCMMICISIWYMMIYVCHVCVFCNVIQCNVVYKQMITNVFTSFWWAFLPFSKLQNHTPTIPWGFQRSHPTMLPRLSPLPFLHHTCWWSPPCSIPVSRHTFRMAEMCWMVGIFSNHPSGCFQKYGV